MGVCLYACRRGGGCVCVCTCVLCAWVTCHGMDLSLYVHETCCSSSSFRIRTRTENPLWTNSCMTHTHTHTVATTVAKQHGMVPQWTREVVPIHPAEMVGALPSKPKSDPKSVLQGKEQPDLHTYSMNRRFILSADRKRAEETDRQRGKEMESSRWGLRKNNQPNEGRDRKATFDHQLSGSHRPAAFVSLCPRMNPA